MATARTLVRHEQVRPDARDTVLTYAAGLLTQVDYADGRMTVLTYDGNNRLTQVVADVPGGSLQKDLAYNPDGTLSGVTKTES